jgi:hypothetical protein
MSLKDGAGLAGVVLILAAYVGTTLGRLNPRGAAALTANFAGASLILLSLLTESFNLSATVMEGAWAVVALIGLVRLAADRLR